ncbi:MAG TPA: hypothetical protein VHB97_09465, partial [Polyangia bacterium]|nr:hypothetical protein [Polyangia bacterium]
MKLLFGESERADDAATQAGQDYEANIHFTLHAKVDMSARSDEPRNDAGACGDRHDAERPQRRTAATQCTTRADAGGRRRVTHRP